MNPRVPDDGWDGWETVLADRDDRRTGGEAEVVRRRQDADEAQRDRPWGDADTDAYHAELAYWRGSVR